MSARDDILSAIRARQLSVPARPPAYDGPEIPGDLVERFAARARAAAGDVRILDSMADVPAAIADLLRARNMEAKLHIPPGTEALDWDGAPGVTRTTSAPGPDDAALAIAPHGIAETGTLAFPAAETRPASWHFRPGFEIAVIRAGDILPRLENVIAKVKQAGAFPHTLNLVTGPSRTGDIEQTLELGAHGPKALAVLIVKDGASSK